MGHKMKTEAIFISIFALIAGVLTYAADWQREQDKKLSELDKLIVRQTTILEMQIDINEKVEERRMFMKSPKNDGAIMESDDGR